MPVNLRRSHWQEFSVWPRNVDVKSLYRGAQPPDDFTGPQRLGQERHPAIFRLAYRAKRIADVTCAPSLPRTGSRFSVSTSSHPTAFTSLPRSSACTSKEKGGNSSAPPPCAEVPGVFILQTPIVETWPEIRVTASARPASRRKHPAFPAKCGTSRRSLLFRRASGAPPCGCARSSPRVSFPAAPHLAHVPRLRAHRERGTFASTHPAA